MQFLFCCLAIMIICAFGKEIKPNFIPQNLKLISDVKRYMRASSVFLVDAGNRENMGDNMFAMQVSKEYSRRGILSRIVSFKNLRYEVEFYRGKVVQPLFVVLLKNQFDLYNFSATTQLFDTSLHTWLVLFRSNSTLVNSYCLEPRSNLFNLKVNTKILVKCYRNPLIKEWFSINRKIVEVYDFATWNYQDGMKQLLQSNFYERRSNLKGIELRVAAVKESGPTPKWQSTMNGFFDKVLRELSKKMNFTIKYAALGDSYGYWNSSSEKWTGIIGRLVDRDIDVGIGEFAMTKARDAAVDFAVPLILTTSNLYIRRPTGLYVDWAAYSKAFHLKIWMLIGITIAVTPIFLSFLWKEIEGYNINRHLTEEYLRVWGIYCQKPLPDFPTSTPLRVAYISIFLSSFVLYAIYSAFLTSYLTNYKPNLPFDTFEGFVNDGTFKLIVIRHTTNHEFFLRTIDPMILKMAKFMKVEKDLPADVFEAVRQVCNERVAFYTNKVVIEKMIRHAPCELMPLTEGRLDNFGFVLTKNSPWREVMNYNLKNLRSFGITDRYKKKIYHQLPYNKLKYLPVTFNEIGPMLIILFSGVILGLLILLCEWIVYHKKLFSKKQLLQIISE